jgi:hypothetical protein
VTLGSHQSGRNESVEWLTPPPIIAALGGAASFDMDPCPAPDAPKPFPTARRYLRPRDGADGLRDPWVGRCFVNPPFDKIVSPRWVAKMAGHGRGILLLHARMETATWRESIYPHASRMLLLRHRQRFYRPDGSQAAHNSGAPVALIAYGDQDAEILAHCGLPGWLSPRGRWEISPLPVAALGPSTHRSATKSYGGSGIVSAGQGGRRA